MKEQIEAIAGELGIVAGDNAVFVVDKTPGNQRQVFVVLDVEGKRWTAFVRDAGRYVITEGTLAIED